MARAKVVVRKARKADMDTVYRMWARSYLVESPEAQRILRSRVKQADVRVAAVDGAIVAAGKVLQLRASLGGGEVSFGGVASLATFPEMRRRGYVQALLLDMLREMREAGCALSGLYPFEGAFYRRYGWAFADDTCTLVMPARRLARRERPAGRIVEVPVSEAAGLEPLRAQFWSRYNLGVARDAWWWRNYMTYEGYSPPVPPRYVYRFDNVTGAPEGYLVMYFSGDGDGDEKILRVTELAAITPDARAALLAFLGDFDSQVDTIELFSVASDPLRAQLERFEDLRFEHRPHQRGMMRIVDLQALVEDRPAEGPGVESILSIEDEHARWNHGTWRLAVSGGRASIKKSRRPADAHLSVQTATQLVTGFLSPADATYAGLVSGPNPQAAAILSRLAGSRVPFHNDMY